MNKKVLIGIGAGIFLILIILCIVATLIIINNSEDEEDKKEETSQQEQESDTDSKDNPTPTVEPTLQVENNSEEETETGNTPNNNNSSVETEGTEVEPESQDFIGEWDGRVEGNAPFLIKITESDVVLGVDLQALGIPVNSTQSGKIEARYTYDKAIKVGDNRYSLEGTKFAGTNIDEINIIDESIKTTILEGMMDTAGEKFILEVINQDELLLIDSIEDTEGLTVKRV